MKKMCSKETFFLFTTIPQQFHPIVKKFARFALITPKVTRQPQIFSRFLNFAGNNILEFGEKIIWSTVKNRCNLDFFEVTYTKI